MPARISAEEFVRTWQTSKSIKEVCEKLQTIESYAYTKAADFRKKGINLKRFENARQVIDVERLAKLADDLA